MQQNNFEPLGIGVGTLVAGRYEIQKRLGSGGSSAVYLARDKALNAETCALKILDPKLVNSQSDLERFRNEVLVTRKLQHPNIVRTFEFGKSQSNYYYLVMEHLEGRSLHDIIYSESHQEFSFAEICRIVHQTALGMAHAHAQEIIHRDLKPANIIVSPNLEVKIADFGLARDLGLELQITQVGQCVGTPAYMAPEQVQGKRSTAAVDIYALGIVAYELVTGRIPYVADDWYKLASQIISDPMPPVPENRFGTPPWFQQFISKATAKAPEDRYSSAEEVVEVFEKGLIEAKKIQLKGRKRKRQPSQLITETRRAMEHSLYHFAPLILILCLLIIVVVMAISSSSDKNSITHVGQTVDKGSRLIEKFASTLERLNKVAVETHQNSGKIDSLLDEIEHSTDKGSKVPLTSSASENQSQNISEKIESVAQKAAPVH